MLRSVVVDFGQVFSMVQYYCIATRDAGKGRSGMRTGTVDLREDKIQML